MENITTTHVPIATRKENPTWIARGIHGAEFEKLGWEWVLMMGEQGFSFVRIGNRIVTFFADAEMGRA